MRDYMRARRVAAREAADILEYECPICHEPFTPDRSDARFCSDACRAADRRRRITITEWIHSPDGWLGRQGGPDEYRPAICDHNMTDECHATVTWCRQKFNHPQPHLIYTSFLCDNHHKQAVDKTRRAAIAEYRQDMQKLHPGLTKNATVFRSKAAQDEAMQRWRKKRHIVKVLPELIAPSAVRKTADMLLKCRIPLFDTPRPIDGHGLFDTDTY
jgi:hypothetical protein